MSSEVPSFFTERYELIYRLTDREPSVRNDFGYVRHCVLRILLCPLDYTDYCLQLVVFPAIFKLRSALAGPQFFLFSIFQHICQEKSAYLLEYFFSPCEEFN